MLHRMPWWDSRQKPHARRHSKTSIVGFTRGYQHDTLCGLFTVMFDVSSARISLVYLPATPEIESCDVLPLLVDEQARNKAEYLWGRVIDERTLRRTCCSTCRQHIGERSQPIETLWLADIGSCLFSISPIQLRTGGYLDSA